MNQHFFSFVKILRHSEALHVEDAHPVLSNQTSLLSAHHVVASCLLLVALISLLSVSKLSDGVTSTTTPIGCFSDDGLKTLHDLFEIGLLGKSNIIVCLVLDGGKMAIFDCCFEIVVAHGVVGRYLLRTSAFDQESCEDVSSIICP